MLRALFVLSILVPGLIMAVRKRFAALLLYVWVALFRPQDFLWFDITSLRLSLLVSVLVVVPWAWFATRRSSPEELERVTSEALPNLTHPLSIGVLLYLVAALLAQTNAVNPSVGWEWIDYFWRLVLVSLVSVSLVSTKQRFILFVAVMAGSLGFYSTKAGVASLGGGGVRFQDGLGGAFADNNGYALGIVMILFLLVASAQNIRHRWVKRGFWITVPLSAFTVVCTFSRGGFLALGAAALMLILLQRRRALALAVMIPIVAVGAVMLPDGYTDRMQTIRTYEEVEDGSALSRLHFWRVAVNMVRDHPLGIGLRNYEWTYDDYDFSAGQYGKRRAVHSSHFEVLAETGFPGIAIWVFLFGYAFFVAFRVRSRAHDPRLPSDDGRFLLTMANGLIVSMVGFLAGGAFIALSLNDLTWMTFALVASLDRLSVRMLAAVTVTDAAPAFSAVSVRAARLQPAVARTGDAADRPRAGELVINAEFRARTDRSSGRAIEDAMGSAPGRAAMAGSQ